MKILLLASEFPPRLGGIATYASQMALAATELGHEVTVVAADYGNDRTHADAAFPFEIFRYAGSEHTMRALPSKIALVRKLARTHPDFDIVHAADWPFYLPLALSPYRRRSRCLLTFHGTEIGFMQQPRRALPLRLVRFWSGWAEPVANSRDTARRLGKAFGVRLSAIRVTGLGVSRFWLDAPHGNRTGADRFVIATVGRVVPRKGHLLLARALSVLPVDVASSIQWQIIGPLRDAAYVRRLRAATGSLACETQILGELEPEEVRQRLAAADLFCLPGMPVASGAVEGYGLAYMEAAACGLASVATRLGGVEDAILDDETGLLVTPDDPVELADAIFHLYSNPAERQRLAANARQRAQASGWQEIAARTYAPEHASAYR